ncbi:hypothetical protein [Leifsonia aquatica]|uniref:hypothetical protein n=1 Tax=Leifsonia aquatica TaxID=144185 RepID=UPI0028A77ECD|nr:hypothetical protein [Leifsonia aquatica]
MPSGQLIAAYAYEVAPQQDSTFSGGAIAISTQLQAALDRTFDRSKIEIAPAVSFMVDTSSPTRAHPIRDAALAVSFATSSQESVVEALAKRLADSMDNRSKSSLLMISVHQATHSHARRFLLWTFPQQEVFNLTVRGGHPQLDMLEAFNRESNLRKAALIEGPNERTGMLTARVLDFQSTAAERAVADLWIVKFLHARLQMSDMEGTQLLARTLRQAHTKTRGDIDAQDQINAAITGLRIASGQRWSIDTVAATYLTGEAERAFLANVRPEERAAMFGIEHDRFDQLIQYKRFTLANGVIVSAPFVEIGSEGGVTITEIGGKRVLQAEGEIEEEQVRTRG